LRHAQQQVLPGLGILRFGLLHHVARFPIGIDGADSHDGLGQLQVPAPGFHVAIDRRDVGEFGIGAGVAVVAGDRCHGEQVGARLGNFFSYAFERVLGRGECGIAGLGEAIGG